MIGGVVINVIRIEGSAWVQCLDRTYAEDTCAVRVIEKNKGDIKPGDKLWWQSCYAFWTSSDVDASEDVRLERIGYSHSHIPEDVMATVLV